MKRQELLLIALLFALAVAQPLLSLLGENAEFFVTHRFGADRIVGFAVALSIGLPLMLIIVLFAANKMHSGVGRTVSQLTQLLLWCLIWLPVASRLGFSGLLSIALSAAMALACVAAWYRFYPVRLLLIYLSPAIILFPLYFLFVSNTSEIVVPKSVDPKLEIAGDGLNRNVVFILFDEFPLMTLLTPELEIDGDRYPNFKRLSEIATWYRNATTPSEVTTHALPVALTGLNPDQVNGQLPIHSNFPQSLFTLLNPTHEVTAWESATLLCPESFCSNSAPEVEEEIIERTFVSDLAVVYAHIVMPRPFSDRLPPVSHGWADFLTDEEEAMNVEPTFFQDEQAVRSEVRKRQRPIHRGAVVEQFIEQIHSAKKPGVYFLHSMLPHSPWLFQPNGKEAMVRSNLRHFGIRPEDDPLGTYSNEWYPARFAVNQALQKALIQIQYVDVLLGKLLDHLDSQGLLDDSLLILASDHGSSFIPGHSRRSIDKTTMSNIGSIPLFIRFPGQERGSLDDLPASLLDILPTVIDVLDLNPGWVLSGNSLTGETGRKQKGDIQIMDATGRVHRFEPDQYAEHLGTSVRELAKIFGTGSTSNLFKFGPRPQLVGHTPQDFRNGAVADEYIISDATGYFRNIKLENTFYPMHVWGRWMGIDTEKQPGEVAVAVNGIIQSTTQTYQVSGYEDHFSAVVPGEVFVEGSNQLQFFAIEELEGELVLREIMQSTSD